MAEQMIEGTVKISQTPYGEVFDISAPGEDIPNLFIHNNRTGKWYALNRKVLASYNLVLGEEKSYPISFSRDGDKNQASEIGAQIGGRIDDLLSGKVAVFGEIEFHFDCVHKDSDATIPDSLQQELSITDRNQ